MTSLLLGLLLAVAIDVDIERHRHRHRHSHRHHEKIDDLDMVFSKQPVGVGTSCPSGVCQDKDATSCTGGRYTPGLCPGPTNVQCCQVARGVGATCTNGICQDSSVTSCAGGSYVRGLCPGGTNVQCCQGGGGGGNQDPSTVTSTCSAFISAASFACGFGKQIRGRGTVVEAATRALPCTPVAGNTFTCATICCEIIPGIPANWISIPGDESSLLARSPTVDPFNFDDRMSLYKIIIEKTRAPFWDNTLGISEGNMMWGLPIQHAWQMRSRRLNAFTAKRINEMSLAFSSGGSAFCITDVYRLHWTLPSPTAPQNKECQTSQQSLGGGTVSWSGDACGFPEPGSAGTITAQVECQVAGSLFRDEDDELTASFLPGPQSVSDSDVDFTVSYRVTTLTAPNDFTTISPWRWWAGMNYYLSVIVYMGAAKAGVVTDLPFAAPSANAAKYCLTQTQCEGSLPFNRFGAVEAWAVYFRGWSSLKARTDTGYVATSSDLDDLARLIWLAHSASIQTSLAIFEPESHFLVELERQMAVGWSAFVEFVAETRLNVDFPHYMVQLPILPNRILTDCDRVQTSCPPRLTGQQQVVVATFTFLFHLSQCQPCFTLFVNAWKNAMSTPAGRQHGRDIIEQTFQDPSTLPGNAGTIIVDYLTSNSPLDLAALFAACRLCDSTVMFGLFGQS